MNTYTAARTLRWSHGLLVLAFLCLAAVPVAGQSDTGRHRDEDYEAAQQQSWQRWWFSGSVGAMASGDLFKVTVKSGVNPPWLAPIGGEFRSDKYTVTLDEDVVWALGLGLRLSRRIGLRADLSWATLPVTAEARVGGTVQLYPYEFLQVVQLAVALEARLLATPSSPYLLLGASLVRVGAEQATELDQSHIGARIGIGYEHSLGRSWSLGAEIRDTIVSLETAQHSPATPSPQYPDITFTEVTPQHFFELLLQVRLNF